MLRFRTRPRISNSVRVGPFRFRVSSKPFGRRGRGWGAAGARVGRRGWLGINTPLGRASARKRRWR